MDLKINLKNYNLSEIKKLITQLDDNDNFDWVYFWSESEINNTFEYFVGCFENEANWDDISKNTNIEWTDIRIETFQDKLNFKILSDNKNLSCSYHTILKFKENWNWGGVHGGDGGKRVCYHIGGLSANPRLPLDIYFLREVKDLLDFHSFGQNPALYLPSHAGLNLHPEFADEERIREGNTFQILREFEDKWSPKGSYYDDGDFNGYANDSIFDNPNIDWDRFEKEKDLLKKGASNKDLPF